MNLTQFTFICCRHIIQYREVVWTGFNTLLGYIELATGYRYFS